MVAAPYRLLWPPAGEGWNDRFDPFLLQNVFLMGITELQKKFSWLLVFSPTKGPKFPTAFHFVKIGSPPLYFSSYFRRLHEGFPKLKGAPQFWKIMWSNWLEILAALTLKKTISPQSRVVFPKLRAGWPSKLGDPQNWQFWSRQLHLWSTSAHMGFPPCASFLYPVNKEIKHRNLLLLAPCQILTGHPPPPRSTCLPFWPHNRPI